MSRFLDQVRGSYNLAFILGKLPLLQFSSEYSTCPACFGSLIVRRVKKRKVYTVKYGPVEIKEHQKKCSVCAKWYGSKHLPVLVKKGNNYSYDCMVQIGFLRYIEKKQILEIVMIFGQKYGLIISATQVRRLAYKFLHYLGRFHYSQVGKINNYLQGQGGYILYVDSTCEGHAPHLLTCIDGQSGFILYSQKLMSENQKDLEAAFLKVKQLFNNPLACVHDMGRGINSAIDKVFPLSVRVICHFHLLRDIGKDLFGRLYQEVKSSLSKKKIYANIRYQTKSIEKLIASKETALKLFFGIKQCKKGSKELLQAILYGYLLTLKSYQNNGDGYGFPFDRPKLVYYNKLKRIYAEMETIEKLPAFDYEILVNCRFYKIKQTLSRVLSDKELEAKVKELELLIKCFDKIRHIMRLALPGDKKGLNDSGTITNQQELYDVEQELKKYIKELKAQKQTLPRIPGVIKQLEKYWDKIFAKGIKVTIKGESKTIIPQRTNNTSEQFYRRLKQLFRRLHGNSKVNKDLKYLPEEIALIENLSNQKYINNLLKNETQLSFEFAQLDINEIKLPFEKLELDMGVSQKIKKTLKNFKPLECI